MLTNEQMEKALMKADWPVSLTNDLVLDKLEQFARAIEEEVSKAQEGTIEVPVLKTFNSYEVIGTLRVNERALPTTPDYCLSLGYKVLEMEGGATPSKSRVTKYKLVTVALVKDKYYARFLGKGK